MLADTVGSIDLGFAEVETRVSVNYCLVRYRSAP